jgi:hypothetical protein
MHNHTVTTILPSLSEEKGKMPPVAQDPLQHNEFSSNDSLYPQSGKKNLIMLALVFPDFCNL